MIKINTKIGRKSTFRWKTTGCNQHWKVANTRKFLSVYWLAYSALLRYTYRSNKKVWNVRDWLHHMVCGWLWMPQPVTINTLPRTNSILQLTLVLIVVGVFIKFTVQTLNAQISERFTDHQRVHQLWMYSSIKIKHFVNINLQSPYLQNLINQDFPCYSPLSNVLDHQVAADVTWDFLSKFLYI